MEDSANDYCDAEHNNATYGCYGKPNHEGEHWCYASKTRDDRGSVDKGYDRVWYWSDPSGNVSLTQEELGILLVALRPVEKFFPELQQKLTDAREATK